MKYVMWDTEKNKYPPLNLSADTIYKVLDQLNDMIKIKDDRGCDCHMFNKLFREIKQPVEPSMPSAELTPEETDG